MKALTKWFIHNPVASNLLMLLILVAGYLTANNMRIEGFPKQSADTVAIDTVFVGAYTEQVDQQVTQVIEQSLEGLSGVKSIKSVSLSGSSHVRVEKTTDASLQRLLDDVRLRIDGIATLPRDAESPTITRNEFNFPAMYILLDGGVDEHTRQQLAEQLKDELLEQSEISKLKLLGVKSPEIRIGTDPHALEKYGLTIPDVAQAIQRSSLRFTSGLLKTKDTHISLRADSQALYKNDFANIPIVETRDGTRVLLGDVATIEDTYEDNDVAVRFNGKPAIGVELLIAQKENLLEISEVVDRVIEQQRTTMPPDVSISTFGDSSTYISERLDLLRTNAFQGLLLVVFLLALFLNTKLAFWVGMGIPISIAGALAVMGTKWIDYSLNDITTFGFIIALGFLVDDAVVVGESVFDERRKGEDPRVGTERGVNRVSTATIFGVLTTIAAFLPMLLIQDGIARVLSSFAGVVILTLLFSLFESKFILPAHLAHIDIEGESKRGRFGRVKQLWERCQTGARNLLHKFRDAVYAPCLEWAIKQRYAVVVAFVSVAVLGGGLILNGKIRSVFLPNVPGQTIAVTMEMDPRAPHSMTQENMAKLEQAAQTINDEYVNAGTTDQPPIKHVLKVVTGAYQGELYAELLPSDARPGVDTTDILNQWRQKVGTLEGATNLSFSASDTGTGGAIELHLFGADDGTLKRASEHLLQKLNSIEGVHNVRDGLKGGQPELRFTLKPEAHHLGFTTEDLAHEVGSRFSGLEIQRVQRAGREVKVFVNNDAANRTTLDDLIQTRVRSRDGAWFSLASIADLHSSYANTYIERRNGKRVNVIQAQVDETVVSKDEIGQSIKEILLPELKRQFPSIEVKPGGDLEQIDLLKGKLVRALILICLLIYVLMAVPLKSYTLPFVIMAVVPFGFIGAAGGHYLMDLPLSLLSFFGMLALTGIVVNDSLVLVTRFNQERESGHDLVTALKNAGVGRFQAIFLTTVTTVAGLMPLIFETSEQAQYLIPAAVSLAFGELFATLITLILVPVLIAIKEDLLGGTVDPEADRA